MKKRKTFKRILIFLAFVLIGVAVWFFFFLDKDQQQNFGNNIGDLFPFGEVRPGNPANQNGGTQITDTEQPGTQITDSEEEEFVGPRLRQISRFPTAGFVPLTQREEQVVVEVAADEEGTTIEEERTILLEEQRVRYSRIQDGTVFETHVTPAKLDQDVVVTSFVPNAERADFSTDGNHVVYQYWNHDENTSETYVASIVQPDLRIEPCPYFFEEEIEIGENSDQVLVLHQFLNKTPQTRVSRTGLNSPGNESSVASEATLTAIKNFQSLNGIAIDGVLGEETRTRMLEMCNAQQKKLAEASRSQSREDYKMTGYFLPQGITEFTVSPQENQFFYLQEAAGEVTGYVRDFVTKDRTELFASPFTEWTPHWGGETMVIHTKPSYLALGFAYSLNPKTGSVNKLFKEKNGLTAQAARDDLHYIISETTNESISTSIFNNETDRLTKLRLKTFPEKCVWAHDDIHVYCAAPQSLSRNNQYPDNWYLGLEILRDSLWKINVETLKETLVSNWFVDYRESIDVTKMKIDEKGEYLYFTDKDDETLWSYRLFDV